MNQPDQKGKHMTVTTITLTDTRPVTVEEDDWPTVASAEAWDTQYRHQANRTWTLRVRQHSDGRCIVYGVATTQFQGEQDRRGGEIVDTLEDVPAAIRRVGERLTMTDALVDECIGDLPPVTLT